MNRRRHSKSMRPSFAVRDIGEKAARSLYKPFRRMAAFIKARGGQADLLWAVRIHAFHAMAGELKNKRDQARTKHWKMTPENVGQLLFSAKPSDVKRLYSSLTEAGRAKAQSAIIYRYAQKAGTGDALGAEKFLCTEGRGRTDWHLFYPSLKLHRLKVCVECWTPRRASTAAAAPPTGVQNNIRSLRLCWPIGWDRLGQLSSGAIAGGVAGFTGPRLFATIS